MNQLTFSKNPAVWVALLGAVAVAVVNSGTVPALSDNAAAYSTLITLLVGVVTRFFVSPAPKPAV